MKVEHNVNKRYLILMMIGDYAWIHSASCLRSPRNRLNRICLS